MGNYVELLTERELAFFWVCDICVLTHLCVWEYGCLGVGVHVCGDWKSIWGIFLSHSLLYFVFHWTWSSLANQQAPRSCQSPQPLQSITKVTSCSFSCITPAKLKCAQLLCSKNEACIHWDFSSCDHYYNGNKGWFYWIIIDVGECNWTCRGHFGNFSLITLLFIEINTGLVTSQTHLAILMWACHLGTRCRWPESTWVESRGGEWCQWKLMRN